MAATMPNKRQTPYTSSSQSSFHNHETEGKKESYDIIALENSKPPVSPLSITLLDPSTYKNTSIGFSMKYITLETSCDHGHIKRVSITNSAKITTKMQRCQACSLAAKEESKDMQLLNNIAHGDKFTFTCGRGHLIRPTINMHICLACKAEHFAYKNQIYIKAYKNVAIENATQVIRWKCGRCSGDFFAPCTMINRINLFKSTFCCDNNWPHSVGRATTSAALIDKESLMFWSVIDTKKVFEVLTWHASDNYAPELFDVQMTAYNKSVNFALLHKNDIVGSLKNFKDMVIEKCMEFCKSKKIMLIVIPQTIKNGIHILQYVIDELVGNSIIKPVTREKMEEAERLIMQNCMPFVSLKNNTIVDWTKQRLDATVEKYRESIGAGAEACEDFTPNFILQSSVKKNSGPVNLWKSSVGGSINRAMSWNSKMNVNAAIWNKEEKKEDIFYKPEWNLAEFPYAVASESTGEMAGASTGEPTVSTATGPLEITSNSSLHNKSA